MITKSLRERLKATSQNQKSVGHWQAISIKFDEIANEFLNVGIIYTHSASQKEVRMLDSFEKVKCLYGKRIDTDYLAVFLQDLESYLYSSNFDSNPYISNQVRLGSKLFGSGETPEDIVGRLFDSIVTLGQISKAEKIHRFQYTSTPKLRQTVIHLMKQQLGISANEIIQEQPYQLNLRNGRKMLVDLPLLNHKAAGSIVSGWYKSPIVVENNILKASQDIITAVSNSDRIGSLSILTPDRNCGLSDKDYNVLEAIFDEQFDKLSANGIDVLTSKTTDDLARKTVAWWGCNAA